MPPLNSKATRELVKKRNEIAGPRSLHRGINYNQNSNAVQTFKRQRSSNSNKSSKEKDPHELLVHHQKINAQLQDIYARTSALHSENATMEERIEESWRQFERIGGKRPINTRNSNSNNSNNSSNTQSSAVLCVNRTAIPFAQRLAEVAQSKKQLRENATWERLTRGEAVDYGETGSALHVAKDKRIALFQRRQLKRAHLLRRVGDPTPLHQSGSYDIHSGVLNVFNKTRRQVAREMARDARINEVHTRHNNKNDKSDKNKRNSKWDVRESENINRPSTPILRFTREFDLEPTSHRRNGGNNKGKKKVNTNRNNK